MTRIGSAMRSRIFTSTAAIGDALVVGVFILLGVFLCVHSAVALNAFGAGETGPGVLPFLAGAVMIVSAGAVLVGLYSRGGQEDLDLPTRSGALRACAFMLLVAATIAALFIVGAMIALTVFSFVELRLLERRSSTFSAVAAVAITAVIYLIFVVALSVPLPHGPMGLP